MPAQRFPRFGARLSPWLAVLLLLAAPFAAHAATAPAFDPVAATANYIASLPAAARAKSDAYFEGGYWLPVWDLLISVVQVWFVLRFRIVQRLRDWALAEKTTRRLLSAFVFVLGFAVAVLVLKLATGTLPAWFGIARFAVGMIAGGFVAFFLLKARVAAWALRPNLHRYLGGVYFIALFAALAWVLNLPWALYTDFFREHAYGLSNLTLGGWFGESLKGLAVNAVMLSLVGSLLYLGIRRAPRRWWLIASGATPFLFLLLIVITPVFLAPIFNTYRPLADAKVRDPILSMARANGVPADNVYEFDASKQTNRISANVSGALGTIRVSLNDNLLNRCTPAEVQAVMGHELGHYVLNHSYKLVIYLSLLAVAGFAFAHWAFGFVQRRWVAARGVGGIDDFAGLPILLAALSAFMLLATPVQNTIVRTTEAEADIFGLNAAREPDAFATVSLKLSDYRKISPGPLEEFVFFDHPSGRSRILMAMRWKAEHLPPPAAVAK